MFSQRTLPPSPVSVSGTILTFSMKIFHKQKSHLIESFVVVSLYQSASLSVSLSVCLFVCFLTPPKRLNLMRWNF